MTRITTKKKLVLWFPKGTTAHRWASKISLASTTKATKEDWPEGSWPPVKIEIHINEIIAW